MESSVYLRGCSDLLLNAFKSSLIYISILAFAIGISEASTEVLTAFLSPVSMHMRADRNIFFPILSVRLSVRLSVEYRYCV